MQKSQSKQATCVNESVLCQLLKMMSLTKKGCEMFTGTKVDFHSGGTLLQDKHCPGGFLTMNCQSKLVQTSASFCLQYQCKENLLYPVLFLRINVFCTLQSWDCCYITDDTIVPSKSSEDLVINSKGPKPTICFWYMF